MHKPSSKKDAEGQNTAEAKRAVEATTEITAQKVTKSHHEVQMVGDAERKKGGTSCQQHNDYIHDGRGVGGDGYDECQNQSPCREVRV